MARGGSKLRSWPQSTLKGRILAAPGGSLLIASFRIGGVLLAFAAMLVASAAVIVIWMVAASITHTPQLSVPVVMSLPAGLALFLSGRAVGRLPDRALLLVLDRLFEVDSASVVGSR
jgi:hypothetical protein